jgi:diguanylate cyclase (GGDEF)-like protein/PAS domain S-box-containing protein
MKDENKTKEQLIHELAKMREKIANLEEITIEDKQAKKELKESEKKYKDLVEETPIGIANIDIIGILTYINKRLEKITGYSREEVVGKNVFKLGVFSNEMLKILKGRLKARLTGGTAHLRREILLKCKNGKWIWIEITAKLIKKWGIPSSLRITVQDITKRKRTENILQESEKKYRELVQNTNSIILRMDINGRITFFNEFAQKFFGYTKDEILDKNVVGTIVPEMDTSYRDLKAMIKDIIQNPNLYTINENENIRRNGERVWILWTNKGAIDKDGHITEILCIGNDITEHKKTEEALYKSQQEFDSLFKSSPEALVYMDENSNILNINPRFTELFGYTLDEVKGKNLDGGIIHPPGKMEEGKRLTKKALKGYFYYETIRKKKDGTLFPVSVSGSNILIDGHVKGILGIYINITERKKLEGELKKLARFDNLTGSCNRGYGLALLDRQLKLAKRNKTKILLAYLDVDNFKDINDSFGHEEGDKVLKEVVKLFKSTLREIDIICRMGGDEFLLIFPESSEEDSPLIRKRIRKNLVKLNRELKRPYKISFSMGFSCYNPDNPQSMDELIRIADKKMYEEKSSKNKKRRDIKE